MEQNIIIAYIFVSVGNKQPSSPVRILIIMSSNGRSPPSHPESFSEKVFFSLFFFLFPIYFQILKNTNRHIEDEKRKRRRRRVRRRRRRRWERSKKRLGVWRSNNNSCLTKLDRHYQRYSCTSSGSMGGADDGSTESIFHFFDWWLLHGESRFQHLIQFLQVLAFAARCGGGRNFTTDVPESSSIKEKRGLITE